MNIIKMRVEKDKRFKLIIYLYLNSTIEKYRLNFIQLLCRISHI